MRKSAFYEKYRITDAKPIDIAKRPLLAKDFADSVTDFLTENFRGLCRVRHNIPDVLLYIHVSEDMAAYFIKLMLAYVNGERMLDINITNIDEDLVMTITSDGDLPYDFTDANHLIRIAKNAGFDIIINDERLVLKAHLTLSAALRVYATSRLTMRGKLNEIFYTGGAIVGKG